MNKRVRNKHMGKQNPAAAAFHKDVADLAKSVPAMHSAIEEVAEDNIALMQAIKRAAEGQEALRTVLLQEIGRLRSDIASEILSQSLRTYCRELSPILNALEGMLGGADFSNGETTRQHVESLAMTLGAALGRMGIERIPIAVGTDLFDSRIHDCVRVCTSLDSPFPQAAARTIVRVQEPGYTVHGRLAMPARVWVQKMEEQEIQTGKEAIV